MKLPLLKGCWAFPRRIYVYLHIYVYLYKYVYICIYNSIYIIYTYNSISPKGAFGASPQLGSYIFPAARRHSAGNGKASKTTRSIKKRVGPILIRIRVPRGGEGPYLLQTRTQTYGFTRMKNIHYLCILKLFHSSVYHTFVIHFHTPSMASRAERALKFCSNFFGVGIQCAITFLEIPGATQYTSRRICVKVVLYSLTQNRRIAV